MWQNISLLLVWLCGALHQRGFGEAKISQKKQQPPPPREQLKPLINVGRSASALRGGLQRMSYNVQ